MVPSYSAFCSICGYINLYVLVSSQSTLPKTTFMSGSLSWRNVFPEQPRDVLNFMAICSSVCYWQVCSVPANIVSSSQKKTFAWHFLDFSKGYWVLDECDWIWEGGLQVTLNHEELDTQMALTGLLTVTVLVVRKCYIWWKNGSSRLWSGALK